MKIVGVTSGDQECWCLLVTKEEFIRITGREPDRFDIGPFAEENDEYRYKLYPDDFIRPPTGILKDNWLGARFIEINIEVKELFR